MLGYIVLHQQGQADQLLSDVAARLQNEDIVLAGAVQTNIEFDPDRPCHMDLRILNRPEIIRISQDLGRQSSGCRLDPNGLERAAGLVSADLDASPQLLIVNKFGKQEAEGRGFRPVIGKALTTGIPVLTTVGPSTLDAFERFAEGFGDRIGANFADVLKWCRTAIGEPR